MKPKLLRFLVLSFLLSVIVFSLGQTSRAVIPPETPQKTLSERKDSVHSKKSSNKTKKKTLSSKVNDL